MNDLERMSAAAKDLQRKMQNGTLMREVLQDHEDDLMEQQHIQLLEGKGSDGNDLRPYYTEDLQPNGYFKSQQTASNYMAWKESLNYPYSVTRGNSDAPNLYINGRFYSEMQIEFGVDALMVKPATPYASEIMAKFGLKRFGLSEPHWQVMFHEKGVQTELRQRMKDLLYGN